MKIKVYVNWHSKEIISEKDLEKQIEEVFEDYRSDYDYFGEWLEKNYEIIKVWKMNDEERIKTVKAFEEYCLSEAREDMLYDWTEKELEA